LYFFHTIPLFKNYKFWFPGLELLQETQPLKKFDVLPPHLKSKNKMPHRDRKRLGRCPMLRKSVPKAESSETLAPCRYLKYTPIPIFCQRMIQAGWHDWAMGGPDHLANTGTMIRQLPRNPHKLARPCCPAFSNMPQAPDNRPQPHGSL
jgi:hypothetical protein